MALNSLSKVTWVVLAIFFAYIVLALSNIYILFNPDECAAPARCISPMFKMDTEMQMDMILSPSRRVGVTPADTTGYNIWPEKHQTFFMSDTIDFQVRLSMAV